MRDPIALGGSFYKLGVLLWGPYMRYPVVLGPYLVPLVLEIFHLDSWYAPSEF